MVKNEKILNDFEKKAFLLEWGKYLEEERRIKLHKIERVKTCEEIHGSNILEMVYYIDTEYSVYRLSHPVENKEDISFHGLMGELGLKHFDFKVKGK